MYSYSDSSFRFCVLFCALFYITVGGDECVTPNGEVAECISIHKCQVLLDAIQSSDKSVVEFAKNSQCGYDQVPLVCCGKNGKYTQSSSNLLPARSYCGFQHSDDYLRPGGDTTSSIDEFPWLAALFYKNNETDKNLCVGSLINTRYVLTTAHCLLASNTDRTLTFVRLGEYNIKKQKDCVTYDNIDECTEPTTDFGIEEKIIHKQYNRRQHYNDIGLIRLNRTVVYSDYVRPICLPLPGTIHPTVGDILSQSGWGTVSYISQSTDVKKKVLVKLISKQNCTEAYKRSKILIRDGHMCTRNTNRTSITCQGDSGGPVMFPNKSQWYQEGIISFGTLCGSDVPDGHVEVSYYLVWIIKNIHR